MWEPLKNALHERGEELKDILLDVLSRLDAVVENTAAKVHYDEFVTRNGRDNTGANTTATIELRASEGFSWRITQVGITGGLEGKCAVYVGAVAAENLIDYFNPSGIAARNAEYSVPRGSALIFHFYEQPNNQACTANIQAEQLTQKPVQEASSGVANTTL